MVNIAHNRLATVRNLFSLRPASSRRLHRRPSPGAPLAGGWVQIPDGDCFGLHTDRHFESSSCGTPFSSGGNSPAKEWGTVTRNLKLRGKSPFVVAGREGQPDIRCRFKILLQAIIHSDDSVNRIVERAADSQERPPVGLSARAKHTANGIGCIRAVNQGYGTWTRVHPA
jgi:hypothetical protein